MNNNSSQMRKNHIFFEKMRKYLDISCIVLYIVIVVHIPESHPAEPGGIFSREHASGTSHKRYPRSAAVSADRRDCEKPFAEGVVKDTAVSDGWFRPAQEILLPQRGMHCHGKHQYYPTQRHCDVVRWGTGAEPFESQHLGWRVCHPAGPFRLREDNHAADYRRLHHTGQRRCLF